MGPPACAGFVPGAGSRRPALPLLACSVHSAASTRPPPAAPSCHPGLRGAPAPRLLGKHPGRRAFVQQICNIVPVFPLMWALEFGGASAARLVRDSCRPLPGRPRSVRGAGCARSHPDLPETDAPASRGLQTRRCTKPSGSRRKSPRPGVRGPGAVSLLLSFLPQASVCPSVARGE